MAELGFAKTYYTTLGESLPLIYRPQEASGGITYIDRQEEVLRRPSFSDVERSRKPFAVSPKRYARDSNIFPRCLTLKEAAAYVGLTPKSYKEAVRRDKYPGTLPGTRRYDRNAIDVRLNAESGITETQHSSIAKPKVSAYDDWFGDEN
jgi:hypothetical protein